MRFKFIFLILILFALPLTVRAAEPVELILFWANGCPHCEAEKEWFKDLQKDYGDQLVIKQYEVSEPGSRQVLQFYQDKLNFKLTAVPVTIVGDWHVTGFNKAETTGVQIKQAIDKILVDSNNNTDYQKVVLPLLGAVNPQAMSLPTVTAVLGLLDGFNPCAMWALIFLISLLLGMGDRRRMLILGAAFIFISGLVYFVFMAAWLNLLLFIGVIFWVRLAIGLIAIAGGAWNLRKFLKDRTAGCEISSGQERRAILDKLKELTKQKNFWLALAGIVALAFTVNLMELICSAGLPAVYIQVLTLNHLANWQYYGYLLFYIFFYMLDDLLIFIIAMATLKLTGLSTKYGWWSGLIGGIVMVIIGLLLIFKHQWLMFG